MKGIGPVIAIGVLIAVVIIGFILSFLFKFYSDTELKLSDRIAGGLSTINYFYLSEKNMDEFLKIATEITAKELGDDCGGFGCNWYDALPTVAELDGRFRETLAGKITGYPEFIGNTGKIKVAPPSDIVIDVADDIIKTTMIPQSFLFQRKDSIMKTYLDDVVEIEKPIRYLRIAKLERNFYSNGTYVRASDKVYVNSGSFDCDDDGVEDKTVTETKLSSAGVDGCKILNINFNVEGLNTLKTECEGITNSADPGENAGVVSAGKLNARIDNMIKYSVLCGVGSVGGLIHVNDFQGTQTDSDSYSGSSDCSESGKSVNCTKEGAVQDTDWAKMDAKISSVLSGLETAFANEYLAGLDIDVNFSADFTNSWQLANYETPDNYYSSCEGTATGDAETGTCSYSYNNVSSSGSCTSTCGDQKSSYSYSHIKKHHEYDWSQKNYYQYLYDCSRSGDCDGYNCCSYDCNPHDCNCVSCNCETTCGESGDCSTSCDSCCDTCWDTCHETCYRKEYSTSESWNCKYTGNYKFTISNLDITAKITDNTLKVVKKGTKDFENLYFQTNFRPGTSYVLEKII